MKNILLAVFTFLSISTFAQSNELSVSFQPVTNNVFGNQISLGYFRMLSPQFALGVKTGVRIYEDDLFTGYSDKFEIYSGSVDLVNRWNLVSKKRFRLMGEFGLSVRRELQNSFMTDPLFCGIFDPRFPPPGSSHMGSTNPKVNQLGYTSGVMIDFLILKSILIGLDYNLKLYAPNESTFEQDYTYSSIVNIKLGCKF